MNRQAGSLPYDLSQPYDPRRRTCQPMVIVNYKFQVTVFTQEGGIAGVFAIPHPDWEPAFEAIWLHALQAGRLTGTESSFVVRLEPCWHATLGQPWVEAFRMVQREDSVAAPLELELPFTLFKPYATQAAATLVKRKALAPDAAYYYLVSAESVASAEVATDLTEATKLRLAPLKVARAALTAIAARSVPIGGQTSDFRVFIPEHLLEEVSEQTDRAGAAETGSILLGHLRRDSDTGALFLEVTAQVPAAHTSASSTRLTFTAATWTAVRAAVALRRQDELMVGWFHSHPQRHWALKCNETCPPDKRAACPLAGAAFFSDDDVSLHRAIFSRGFCVALLVTATEAGLRYAMFGWRQGSIQQRGFELIAERDPARFCDTAAGRAIVGDNTCHE
jgi:proteasome lid subunit RPN8/RPN11